MNRILLSMSVFVCAWAGAADFEGNFAVSSKNRAGRIFQSPASCTQHVTFTATGLWNYLPSDNYHGPEGLNGVYALPGYFLPGAQEGALLVRRATGVYEVIGNGKTVSLGAHERVSFVMNDDINTLHGDGFADNRGALLVEWKATRCE